MVRTCRSADGLILVASSKDGYCTIIRFDNGELGVPLAASELPVGARKVVTTNIDVSPPVIHTAVDMPSTNPTTPHRETPQVASSSSSSSDGLNRKPGPRRVQLITLSTTPQSVAAANVNTATSTTTITTTTITTNTTSTSDSIVIL